MKRFASFALFRFTSMAVEGQKKAIIIPNERPTLAGLSAWLFTTIIISSPPANAAFAGCFGPADTQLHFEFTCNWDRTNNAPNPQTLPGPIWNGQFRSNVGALGVTDLTLNVQHTFTLRPAGHEADAIKGGPITLGIDQPPLGGQVARAGQEKHTNHFDVVRFLASRLGAGDTTVNAKGDHSDALADWSFKADVAGRFSVFATFPISPPPTQELVRNRVIQAGESLTGQSLGIPLPRGATDYHLVFTSNPTTEFTLAFLGQVNGVPGQLDLGAAFDLFEDINPILAPMFLDAATDPIDLFIAVNLTEWLSFPTPFAPFDIFGINAGTSVLLPGFLFSRSQILLSPDGFSTTDPFSGQVFVAGTVDGSTRVDEPNALLLLATSALLLLGCERHRKRIRTVSTNDPPHGRRTPGLGDG